MIRALPATCVESSTCVTEPLGRNQIDGGFPHHFDGIRRPRLLSREESDQACVRPMGGTNAAVTGQGRQPNRRQSPIGKEPVMSQHTSHSSHHVQHAAVLRKSRRIRSAAMRDLLAMRISPSVLTRSTRPAAARMALTVRIGQPQATSSSPRPSGTRVSARAEPSRRFLTANSSAEHERKYTCCEA
jgi:hypothetical protein